MRMKDFPLKLYLCVLFILTQSMICIHLFVIILFITDIDIRF